MDEWDGFKGLMAGQSAFGIFCTDNTMGRCSLTFTAIFCFRTVVETYMVTTNQAKGLDRPGQNLMKRLPVVDRSQTKAYYSWMEAAW